MKISRTNLLLACAATLGASMASAANINVPGDQATVQAAINAANTTGDTIIVAAGNYSGTIDINGKSLTLRGASAASRPVFTFTGQAPIAASTVSGGMIIHGDGINVTVQDIVFLPGSAMAAGAKGVLAGTNTAGATMTVAFRNLLFAPSAAANTPQITSAFDDTALAAFPGGRWPNDVIYLMNRNLVGMLSGVGIYTFEDVVVLGSGREGIVCYPNGVGSSLTGTGIVVGRSGRNAIQWGDDNSNKTDFTLTGTRAHPSLLIRGNNEVTASTDVTVTGINAARNVAIDHMVSITNPVGNAVGFNVGVGTVASITITDSLFAASKVGLTLSENGASAPTANIRNNTFFNNETGINVTDNDGVYTFTDNVFAGAGTGVNMAVNTGAKVTLNKNAFVLAGPNTLTAATSGESPVSNTPGPSADPQFASTSVASLAALQTSFDVVNGVYFTASSTSGPLNGWGSGPASGPTAAGAWEMYQ